MTQGSFATPERTPIEVALRHLGSRRYGSLVDTIEYAIRRPNGRAGMTLAPLTGPTAILRDWTPAERAGALWSLITEGILDPHVSSSPTSRRRRALQAAFRIPDDEIDGEWGASLADRFKQLKSLRLFNEATSTQPMEISWKRGVEGLAEYLADRLEELTSPDDWARYKSSAPEIARGGREPTEFRRPSEGAQKLVVNLYLMTVIMRGKAERRRISERLITSQDDDGLRYYTAMVFASGSELQKRDYVPTRPLWGCEAEQVEQDGMSLTRLWFPQSLKTGEKAHFATEAWHDMEGDDLGWANVDVDHYGIEPGELRDGLLPVSGLTIRIRFDPDVLPKAVWWYAELNERERYAEPPPGSPRRLEVVSGGVVKTFADPCQPRESYGIAYRWT